jgi:hypothetical protein
MNCALKSASSFNIAKPFTWLNSFEIPIKLKTSHYFYIQDGIMYVCGMYCGLFKPSILYYIYSYEALN